MIALRGENSVVVIFVVVLLSYSRASKRKCACALGAYVIMLSSAVATEAQACAASHQFSHENKASGQEKMDKWDNILNYFSGSVWASFSMLYFESSHWIDEKLHILCERFNEQ